MKYLKTFESIDLEKDLRDFCETYLAYLLDGDFQLDVIWMGHDYMVHPEDCYTINLIKLNDYGATGFTWNEVKDSYIPFLHMLNKKYQIMDEGEDSRTSGQWDVPCICLYNGSQNFCVSVKDVLSGEPLPGRYDNVPLLEITLQVMMKKITESVELKTDDIEHYLAYLIDEDFEVKSIIKGGGFSDVQPQQSISMERKLTQEEWRDILMTGLTTKSVMIGVKSAPMRVHSSDRFKPAVALSNYKCEMLDQIESLAQDCADKLLLSLSDQFSSTKIIMSFKTVHNHGETIFIRLQIILIE
jgi:hypothetical protein